MIKKVFYSSQDSLAETLAQLIASNLEISLKEQDNASLILPGGNSPRRLITNLARLPIPWEKIYVSTTDERDVPLASKDSNSGQIKYLFAAENTHINPIWMLDTNAFNKIYSPYTVTVLGMGLDAHIASIFCHTPTFEGKGIFKSRAPVPPYERYTMSFDSLLDTNRLMLLVSGKEKWKICQEVIAGELQLTPLEQLIHKAKEILELHIVDV